jgi:hypothetical protein
MANLYNVSLPGNLYNVSLSANFIKLILKRFMRLGLV